MKITYLADTSQEEVEQFLAEWNSALPYVVGHTSGSTGEPNPIELLKADMRASARITNSHFGIDSNSCLLLSLSPTYIAGKMVLVRAIEADCHLLVVKPSANPLLIELPNRVDIAAVVPMQLEHILNNPQSLRQLTDIKHLIIGGAAVSEQLRQRLQSLSTRCFATYGMTETLSHIALKPLNGEAVTPCYHTLAPVTCSTDERGCLVIHAPHLSANRFVTNDVVTLHSETVFEWVDRFDRIINSGGVKVSPERVEKLLAPYIATPFFITSQPDALLGERVVLVIEGEHWNSEEIAQRTASYREVLSRYEMPKEVLFLPKFHTTYSGKIIKRLL